MYIFGGYEDILGSTELMWSFDMSTYSYKLQLLCDVCKMLFCVVSNITGMHFTATLPV